jgi:predicted GH43/DUF377 family glycosyl hydrolase
MQKENESEGFQVSELVKKSYDRGGVLLFPDGYSNEIAVFNSSICPNYLKGKGYPILSRVRIMNKPHREFSLIKRGYLETPTKMSEDSKVLMRPDEKYSKLGREDARIVKKDSDYYITSIAFDGENTRVILDTSSDLEKITHQGVMGDILLEKAMSIVGSQSYYGRLWSQQLQESKLERKTKLIGIKDVALEFLPDNKIGLWYRIEPNMQFSVADSISDFFRKDYWENEIENLMDRTIMTKEKDEIKIGLGGPPIEVNGNRVGTYHKVTHDKQGDIDIYYYFGSFFEFDSYSRKITSRLRNPLLVPEKEDALVETDERNRIKTVKLISFPMGMIVDPENLNELYVYYGGGDRKEVWRTTQVPWLSQELSNDFNRENIVNFEE